MGKLASINDLHAADAVYHRQCNSNLTAGEGIPSKYVDTIECMAKRPKVGRPEAIERTEAFRKVTGYFEARRVGQNTINDPVQ